VFAATFPLALGLYRAAEELGMRIPDDIDIIAFSNSGLNQALAPPMSFIEQPTYDLGRKALDLTLEHIRYGSQFVPRLITLPTKLILARTALKHPHSGPKLARHPRSPLPETQA
jgi:LacI family transcriptional regulator